MEYKSNLSLKREITDAIRMAAIMVTGAFQDKYRQPKFIENAEEDSLYIRLTRMVDDGQMGAVEDCLWERLERGDIEDFRLTFAIYSYMNEKEDDFLREHDFSREEIQDGVEYVLSRKRHIYSI